MSARVLLAALTLSLLGCFEPDAINACALGCERGGKAMLKYSKADGCTCGDLPKDAGALQ